MKCFIYIFYCCLVFWTQLLLFALKYARKEYKLYLLPNKKVPVIWSLTISSLPFSVILLYYFPHGCPVFDNTGLAFLKQIPVLPYPKTLQLLFFWKCSSPRPAWLATSLVWASPVLFKSHNEILNPLYFLLLLKGTLSLYPLLPSPAEISYFSHTHTHKHTHKKHTHTQTQKILRRDNNVRALLLRINLSQFLCRQIKYS